VSVRYRGESEKPCNNGKTTEKKKARGSHGGRIVTKSPTLQSAGLSSKELGAASLTERRGGAGGGGGDPGGNGWCLR